MKTKLLILLPLTGALSLHGALSIVNPDFEADGTSGSSLTISSWFEELETGGSSSTGDTSEQALDADLNTNIPGTNNMWGHIVDKDNNAFGNPAIYQNLGTWNTGDATSYDFSMLLGDRSNQAFGDLTVEFLTGDVAAGPADGTPFSTAFTNITTFATDTTGVIDGGAGTATQTYSNTFNLVGLTDGDAVYLRVSMAGSNTGSAGSQRHSLIDDLTIAAVPEASTYAIVAGIAALGLALLRRRR